MKSIRLLIVDDSALVRKLLSEGLAHDPDIEVVGTAVDPYAARDKILALDPDVITLDIEMPRMDGLTFLRLVMKHRPMPVVVMSSLTAAGSAKALEALQAGAVEVVAKPAGAFSVGDRSELAAKIKAAAHSRLRRRTTHGAAPAAPASASALMADAQSRPARAACPPAPVSVVPVPQTRVRSTGRRSYPRRSLILLGASTGGTEALKVVLSGLPADMPGICVVQHIPAYFSAAFAERLNQLCELEVREARRGDEVQPGLVLVAPGGQHMVLRWTGSSYLVDLNAGPPVHHQRPAVDVLFDSAQKAGAGPTAMAAVLTGMGADGAAGLVRLREAGAETLAQDEASCVVFGMPREAIRQGGAREVLPLEQIAGRLNRYADALAVRAGAGLVGAA